jgi:predicted DNA-binding transcriptional regulator YafY
MDSIDKLPKNVYDRLEYLEFMLRFRGWVSRSDLTDRFGLGEAAATRDIRLYRELSPDNLRLNQSTKKYEILDEVFRPVFDLRVQTALSKLRGGKICDALGMGDSGGFLCPARLVLPDVDVLATITRAISVGAQLKTVYRSVKNGQSEKRLVPHALFDNGIHWYMRAFDLDKNKFMAYALTRICEVDIDRQVKESPDLKLKDFQWSRMVSLELIPHPNRKNVPQPKTIDHDFKMKDGVLKLMVRAAVVGYWLHHWNVDCTEDHHLKGYDYQLWLRNHQTLYDVESRGIAPGLSTYDQD